MGRLQSNMAAVILLATHKDTGCLAFFLAVCSNILYFELEKHVCMKCVHVCTYLLMHMHQLCTQACFNFTLFSVFPSVPTINIFTLRA